MLDVIPLCFELLQRLLQLIMSEIGTLHIYHACIPFQTKQ